VALFLATQPELPPGGGEGRCGYRLEPGPAPARFLARGRARVRVLEGPAGLAVGYLTPGQGGERVELLRLAEPVAPCARGPGAAFAPPGPFGIYAGSRRTGAGLWVLPARTAGGKRVFLIEGPGLLLELTGAAPASDSDFPRTLPL